MLLTLVPSRHVRVVEGHGEYRAGEAHVLFLPDEGVPRADLPPVLYCHEHGAGARTALQPILAEHFTALTDAGVVGLSADLGGPATWGCDAALDAVDDARRFLVDAVGAPAARLSLYGGSMGTMTALAWALEHRDEVGAVGLLVPLFDLVRFHRDDPLQLAWEIDEAYGGREAFLRAAPRRSPLAYAADLAGVPVRAWFSSDDPMAPPEDVAPFVASVGPSASAVDLGRHGHSPVGVTGDDVRAWFTGAHVTGPR